MVPRPVIPDRTQVYNLTLYRLILQLTAREEERQQGLFRDHVDVSTRDHVVHDSSCAVQDVHWDLGSGLPLEDPEDVEEEAVPPRLGAVHGVQVLVHAIFVSKRRRSGYMAPRFKKLFDFRHHGALIKYHAIIGR